MKEEILTDTLLRQYLLGKIDDEERQRIEKLFITDSQARDRVLAAEQELIEDYLDDSLTTADKEIFLSHYARTPEQQRKLRIDKSIKEWAVREAQAPPLSSSIWSRFLETLRLRPAFLVPIAIAILIAIVIAAIWLNRTMEYRAIQQEVAQLNTPASLSQNPTQMVLLRLIPVTVRSGEGQNEITKRVDTQLVELHLLTIQKEPYSTYHAVVHRIGEKEPIVTVDGKAENSNLIRFRLPAYILPNGSYRIQLSGIATDGSQVPTEEYTFAVD
jgi:anti-sigma factor RsiW